MFGFLLQLLHRAFVPQDGSALGQGGTHGQDALVAGPPEPQPKVFQPNHKRTVYQNIQLLQQFPAVLPHAAGGQVLKQIAGVAPDVLFRESGPHLTHKIQHGGLVGGVEGLAPQEGETFDIGLFQRLEDLTGLGLGEGLAVGEVPGLRVEALRQAWVQPETNRETRMPGPLATSMGRMSA